MKFLWLGALSVALVVLVSGLALVYWMDLRQAGPSPEAPVAACGSEPALGGRGTIVPSGQYALVTEDLNNNSNHYGGPVPQSRLSIWAQSNSTYSMYILSQSDYESLGWTSNATGNASHSTAGPAQHYVWDSGPVTSTNHTVLLGNGDWYVVVYNPASVAISIRAATGGCNAP
ncbi:MAG: hypothetical protein L3K19_05375 [Thermoplasmata archaeon]|nr:hypothetical protein [Thermoplasmata archaeon]